MDIETISLLNDLLADTLKLREKAEKLISKTSDYFGASDYIGIDLAIGVVISETVNGLEKANQCENWAVAK